MGAAKHDVGAIWSGLVVAVLTALFALLAAPGAARAADVLVLQRDGHISRTSDPLLPAQPVSPRPTTPAAARGFASEAKRTKGKPQVTVVSTLAKLHRAGAISDADYTRYLSDFKAALKSEHRLKGTRKSELTAITVNLHQMAVNHTLTAPRLPALFLTLERNRRWWTTGPLLSYGQRVEFAGSPVAWEYYPGQGIELTALGNFGKADAACKHGLKTLCGRLLADMIPLAAQRAGGLAWEYYFHFDGGAPPWTSAMSQATALAALADGYRALHDPSYLSVAHEALPVLQAAPPTGAAVTTTRGLRFIQYTFAPGSGSEIINAFLQTLIGLDTYARVSHDPMARQLFAEGDAEAMAELPSFNTGAWSLYQPGLEDDLSYHELVTGFLRRLCRMTHEPIYCSTATAFAQDLKTPPALKLLTRRVTAHRTAALRFTLSKISHVGIVVARGTKTVFLTSARFPYGTHAFTVPGLPRAGTYTVRLAATDLAGNFASYSFPLKVAALHRPCGKAKKRCGSKSRRTSRSLRRLTP